MQISRYWRLNAQRYRLEGYADENGDMSLQGRTPSRTEATPQQPAYHAEPTPARLETPAA